MWNWIKKLHDWANKHEWLLILLIAVIVLRLPSLTTPHFYGDEEIYFVMGRAWREGVPLYKAMFDHKPPLIYMLAGVANTIFTFRLALLVSMLAHTILFWKLAQLFWAEKKQKLAYVSSALFVILTSIPSFEGLIVNAELLMMLPLTLSILMIWKAPTSNWKRYALAGLVAGIGWLYKIPVALDVAAIAIYMFLFREKTFFGSLKALFKPAFWLYIIGFITPLALTFVYYYLKGSGPDYLATVVTVNLGYVSSWSTSSYAFNPFKSGLLVRGMILFAFTLFFYIFRHKMNKRFVLAALWLAFSMFGALLSDRPYPHYLQEPIVPFALFLPFLFASESVFEWIGIAIVVVLGIATQKVIGFGAYPTIPIYTNFVNYLTGKMTRADYVATFDNTGRNYEIGAYLNEHLTPTDQIYVWGTDATVYNLTNRLPTAGKYIVSFHVRDLNQYDYTMSNLEQSKPAAVVVIQDAGDFPTLTDYLSQYYILVKEVGQNQIYFRLAKQ